MSGHCRAPAELYEKAWDFMKAHPFGVTPEPFAMGIPADYPEHCAISNRHLGPMSRPLLSVL